MMKMKICYLNALISRDTLFLIFSKIMQDLLPSLFFQIHENMALDYFSNTLMPIKP
jgi:hypothetical protein